MSEKTIKCAFCSYRGWGHGGGQEEFGKTKSYKWSRKQRKVPDFLRNQELFGGDYWTRTSDLLRVNETSRFTTGLRTSKPLRSKRLSDFLLCECGAIIKECSPVCR